MDLYFAIVFLLSGVIAGFLAGMLGIGGGAILIPFLHAILPSTGIPEGSVSYFTIGTSLFVGLFASSSSAFNHFKKGNIDFIKAVFLGSGAVVSAFLLPILVVEFPQDGLQIILAVALSGVALKMLFEKRKINVSTKKKMPEILLVFFGLLTGALSAFTGLGGGVIFMPLLLYLFAVETKKSIGTSSLTVAVTTASSVISFALLDSGINMSGAFGYIDLHSGIPLAVGAIVGASFGVKAVVKTDSYILKKIFAVILIISVIKIFF